MAGLPTRHCVRLDAHAADFMLRARAAIIHNFRNGLLPAVLRTFDQCLESAVSGHCPHSDAGVLLTYPSIRAVV